MNLVKSLSVRHESDAPRPALRFRRTTALIGLGIATLFALQFGCGDWPPGDRNDAGGNHVGAPPNTNGVCSGTPLPCSALVGAECSGNAGCTDNGSCVGTPTNIGLSCSTSSPTDCALTAGCIWSGACTGTPYGTCSALTDQACLQAKGCIWTPRTPVTPVTTGSGGAAGACVSYLASCASAADCDCGYTCVKQCPSCTAACGNACVADSQCTGLTAGGVSTPFCKMVLASTASVPYSGRCSATP